MKIAAQMIDLWHQFFHGGDETRLVIGYNKTWLKIFRQKNLTLFVVVFPTNFGKLPLFFRTSEPKVTESCDLALN